MTVAKADTAPDLRRLGLVIGAASLAAGVDLTVKAVVSTQLASGTVIDWGVLSIQLVYNPGVAFSLGSTLPSWVISVLTGAIIVALGGYLITRSQTLTALSSLGAALLLGGALGNFIDRLDGGGVVDYLHTGWFATFNLADVFVTVGVAMLTLGTLVGQRNPTRTLSGQNAGSRPSRR
ncbi:signal peptidase II [Aurantimicrobium minutum]|uniref:signal peptidase II n=1 Tax=Aurantimicrobium minutum TaxID=708131 RepID=UPI0024738A13|nr:signal peptidase II [Aurantimicrobium minutum]MDH6532948.1 signal peptidase II [Aurantimicrobium minutum]